MKHMLESRLQGETSIAQIWKEESEKVGLKLNIQKTKIMASGPITPWQIDGETVETVTDFIFLGSKITADSDYSREIKRRLLLGRKTMTNLDSALKNRDITWLTKEISSVQFSSVAQSCLTLQPHESQHTRSPCPSPAPRVYSNSCPLSRCAIQPSHPLSSPSPPAFNLSQHQGFFKWVSSSHQVAKILAFQLPMNSQDWSPLRWPGWVSLLSKGFSRVFSSITIWSHWFFGAPKN